MPWDIENYHIVDGRVLNVEISVPLMEFLYTSIDDVKEAWMEMLGEFMNEEEDVEMSWEMRPSGERAIVTIMIAKPGELSQFTDSEAKGALGAVDALYDREQKEEKKPAKKKTSKKKKAKTKSEKKSTKKKASTKKETKPKTKKKTKSKKESKPKKKASKKKTTKSAKKTKSKKKTTKSKKK